MAGAILARGNRTYKGFLITLACGLAARQTYRALASWRDDARLTREAVTAIAEDLVPDEPGPVLPV